MTCRTRRCSSRPSASGSPATAATTVKIGKAQGEPRDFDPVRGLDTAELFAFIGATQAKAWNELIKRYGGTANVAQAKFADRLASELDKRGTVDVLRHGVVDQGVTIRLAYFRPAHGLTPELVERYEANRLTVTRQLPLRAGLDQDAGSGVVRQRHPGGDGGAEEPADRPDRRARDRAVPHRPGPEEPDAGAGRWCTSRSTRAGGDDDPPGRQADTGSCRSTGATAVGPGTRRTRTGTAPRTCGSGCGSATPGWTCWPGSCTSSRPAKGSKAPGDGDLPALPPVGRGAAAGGRGPRRRAPGQSTWCSTRRGRASRTRSPGWRTGCRTCTTGDEQGVRQGRGDHRPGGARPAAAGHDLPVRARPRGGGADRQVLPAARRGAGRGAGPDHHHHAAEVPVRARQGRGPARRGATR